MYGHTHNSILSLFNAAHFESCVCQASRKLHILGGGGWMPLVRGGQMGAKEPAPPILARQLIN